MNRHWQGAVARLAACVAAAFILSACGLGQSESASSPGATGSGDLKIRKRDGKKVTLHDWTLDGDTLRGTRDVWVDYEKVRQPQAFALSDVTMNDGKLAGDSLRAYLEARQAVPSADQSRAPTALPGTEPPPAPAAAPSLLRVRLRLVDDPETRMQGTMERASPESLWLVPQGKRDTLAVARTSVLQLQSLAGSTGDTGKGARIGGGVGLAVALGLVVAIATDSRTESPGAVPYIVGTAAFVAVGALVGAFLGSIIKKDVWVDAPMPDVVMDTSADSTRAARSQAGHP